MEDKLFKGWTNREMQGAFTRARLATAQGCEQQAAQARADAAFWRSVAYIGRLTGDTPEREPTP